MYNEEVNVGYFTLLFQEVEFKLTKREIMILVHGIILYVAWTLFALVMCYTNRWYSYKSNNN